MAKKSQGKRVRKEPTRKQLSRLANERKQEKLLIWGAAVIVLLLVSVLGYGVISETYIKARRPVAIAGDTPIQTAEFQARVRFTRLQMRNELSELQFTRMSLDPDDESSALMMDYFDGQIRSLEGQLAPESALVIGDQVLEQLINEKLIRQECERRGTIVSADDVQAEIEMGFGYERSPAPEAAEDALGSEDTVPTPTPMTLEAYREQYGDFVDQVLGSLNIPEPLYIGWIESALLSEKLQDAMAAESPTSDDQVKVNVMSLSTVDQADEILARWDSGEEFQSLSDELSASEVSEGYGQEVDWLPKDIWELQFGADVADLVFGLEVGERGGPVQGSDTRFYLIEMLGHEMREMDEYVLQQRASQAFSDWLSAQQAIAVERVAYSPGVVPTDP